MAVGKVGRQGLMEYIESNGCWLIEGVCDGAALCGHLEIWRWLHENRHLPSGSRTWACAAEGGHLELLKFLHTSCCPWDAHNV